MSTCYYITCAGYFVLSTPEIGTPQQSGHILLALLERCPLGLPTAQDKWHSYSYSLSQYFIGLRGPHQANRSVNHRESFTSRLFCMPACTDTCRHSKQSVCEQTRCSLGFTLLMLSHITIGSYTGLSVNLVRSVCVGGELPVEV